MERNCPSIIANTDTSFSFLFLDCQGIKKARHISIINAGREISFQIKNSLGPTDLQSFEANTVQTESRTLSRITRTITENSSPSRWEKTWDILFQQERKTGNSTCNWVLRMIRCNNVNTDTFHCSKDQIIHTNKTGTYGVSFIFEWGHVMSLFFGSI